MNISTTRVETLSDGVVAIIITIMVLEFKLPDISKEVTSAEIQKHLVHLLPYFGVYFLAFS